MLTFSLRASLSAVLAACIALPAMAFGIGLQPTTVELEIVPGDRNRQVINIANVHTEKTISLTLGLADWELDDNGQLRLSPPGEHDYSAGDWARFSPAFLTLKPGESEQIIVDIATPTRLKRSGDFRFALLASTILPEDRAGQSGVWKKYQIATLFYLTTGPANSEPSIAGSEVVTGEDGRNMLHLDIANSGNAHARLQGVIEVSDGTSSETITIGNLVVLHEAQRNYVTPLPESIDASATIEVKLNNIFAPQTNGRAVTLPPYKVPSDNRRVAIATTPDSETLP